MADFVQSRNKTKHRMNLFKHKEKVFVDETQERSSCESQGKLFVSGYYNLKGNWVGGYCRTGNTYYHITEKRNLPEIAKHGLIPHQDNSLSAVEMRTGKVTNVFLRDEDTDFMRNFFHTQAVRNQATTFDPVILEVEVEPNKVRPLHKYKADFVWGVIEEDVPPSRIRVKDTLFIGDRKNLETLRNEFEKNKGK
jgi:hypothetical protein